MAESACLASELPEANSRSPHWALSTGHRQAGADPDRAGVPLTSESLPRACSAPKHAALGGGQETACSGVRGQRDPRPHPRPFSSREGSLPVPAASPAHIFRGLLKPSWDFLSQTPPQRNPGTPSSYRNPGSQAPLTPRGLCLDSAPSPAPRMTASLRRAPGPACCRLPTAQGRQLCRGHRSLPWVPPRESRPHLGSRGPPRAWAWLHPSGPLPEAKSPTGSQCGHGPARQSQG